MKLLLTGLFLISISSAQFGIDKLKDKIDSTNQKTKPVTDRAQRAADTFTPWTPEEEQQIGEASAEKMVAIFGLTDAPQLQRYVNLVGCSVARYASRELPWRFGVLNTEIVGAYALPGGYIFITRGSLASMANEAQLAGALGHEIEHAAARHLESEIRSRKASSWASEEAIAKTKTGQQLARLRADAVLKDLFSTSLSRSKEDDADEKGARMAAASGYASDGLLQFIQILAVENAAPGNRRLFGQLLSTHPSFDERVAHLTSLPTNRSKGKTLEARFARALGR
jgi:beta-barrel assembly-enhancing protease